MQALVNKVMRIAKRGNGIQLPLFIAYGDGVWDLRGGIKAPTKTIQRVLKRSTEQTGGGLYRTPEKR